MFESSSDTKRVRTSGKVRVLIQRVDGSNPIRGERSESLTLNVATTADVKAAINQRLTGESAAAITQFLEDLDADTAAE